MQKLILTFAVVFVAFLFGCLVYSELSEKSYGYYTHVIRQTRGTANWVDTSYKDVFNSDRKYNVGDTLNGLSTDQVVLARFDN